MLPDHTRVKPNSPVPYFVFNTREPTEEELKEMKKLEKIKNRPQLEDIDWSQYSGCVEERGEGREGGREERRGGREGGRGWREGGKRGSREGGMCKGRSVERGGREKHTFVMVLVYAIVLLDSTISLLQ